MGQTRMALTQGLHQKQMTNINMKILIAKWDTVDDSPEYTLHFIENDTEMEIFWELERLDDPYEAEYKVIEDDHEIQYLSGCGKDDFTDRLSGVYDVSESPAMSVEMINK